MKNSKGFGAVEALLIVVIVGLIGFVGWYVWDSNNNSNELYKASTSEEKAKLSIQLPDSTKTFQIKYPDSWTVKKYVFEPCCEGEQSTIEPDWTKQTQPITLIPKGAGEGIEVKIDAVNSEADSVDSYIKNGIKDQFNTYTKLKINGYDAVYHKVDFKRSDGSEGYLEHYYYVVHENKSVTFYFRETAGSKKNNFKGLDGSQYLAGFQSTVHSIKFL